jgi:hypothetical protein
MITNLNLTYPGYVETGKGRPAFTRRAAASLFDRALRQGLLRRLWGKFTGKSSALQTLSHRPVTASTSHKDRIVFVPVKQVVGSENRVEDFDRDFNPLKLHHRDRWIGIAIARKTGVVLPPVELIQAGDHFYVRDGHHRISVARFLGQLEIEARIVN